MDVTGGARRLGLEDEPHFHALFTEVYGHACPRPMYEWKYRHAGARAYGYFENGELIAHCATFARPMQAFGAPATAVQLADLMASRRHVRHLARQSSPFFRTVDMLLAEAHRDEAAVLYGFPSGRAMRLGERLGVFAPIDDLYELTLSPRAHTRVMHRTREHHAIESCAASITAAWEDMRTSLREHLVCDRDPAYIARRYFDHPVFDYRVFELGHRLRRRPLGVFVLKATEEGYEIADLVCALSNMPACVAAAAAIAHAEGRRALNLWITSDFVHVADALAQDRRALEIRIMASPRQQRPALEAMRGRWFLTSGDTDYR